MAAKRPTPAKRTPSTPEARRNAERIVSIPDDVVLSPQSEVPRHLLGQGREADRSGGRRQGDVRELSWAGFDQQVQALSRAVHARFRPQAVVGVAHGGVFVGGALASQLGCEHYPVRISRRSRDTGARSDAPRLSGSMPKELKGLRVLVVDDVASSGDTLQLAVQLAKKAGAREVMTATLLQREGGFQPDFVGETTDALVVFPWDYGPVVEDARFEVDPDKAGA